MQMVVARKVHTAFPGESLEPGAVIVDGGSIVAVGHPEKLAAGHTGPVIDLGAAVIVPGFIDSHVHLGFDASEDAVGHMMASTDHQLLVTMLYSARQLLEAGVTTARDLGARSYLDVVVRDAITAGLAPGPSLLVANRPITTTGGHCWFMGCECDDVISVRRAVRDHHKAGADWVKIMATGGMMTAGSAPWFAQYSEPELVAAVEEARRLGMRVAAHAHGTPGILAAARAGVDTIEHCSFAGRDNRVVDRSVIDVIAAQGVAVCPTTNARWPDLPEEVTNSAYERIDALRSAGVRIIAGTDAGVNLVAHRAYAGGLLTLERLGLPRPDVLAAATSEAAAALGIGDVTGRLTPGRRADLVALGGDPLEDLTATGDVRWVMSNGVVATTTASPARFPV